MYRVNQKLKETVMAFVTRVEVMPVHHCTVPARTGLGEGSRWACDDCGILWGMTTCIGDYANFLDWRQMRDQVRFVSILNVNRFPVNREREPAAAA